MTPIFAARAGAAAGTIDGHAVMSFDELLVSADIVSLHVPLTPATRHLVDRRVLARMRRSAFLINTARGPVVDEEALAWALGERLIAGAALDVYEREPAVHPALLPLENVVLAPHLGSATRETRTAMAELAARNVAAVLGGAAGDHARAGMSRIDDILKLLRRSIRGMEEPAVEKISEDSREDPFQVLISTMLSAQTRDPVTHAASMRLLQGRAHAADDGGAAGRRRSSG